MIQEAEEKEIKLPSPVLEVEIPLVPAHESPLKWRKWSIDPLGMLIWWLSSTQGPEFWYKLHGDYQSIQDVSLPIMTAFV